MFVLGIDPGLARTGYGLVGWAGGKTRATAAGVLTTSRGAPVPERLAELHRDVLDLISEHRPSAMAIETLFVNRNVRTSTGVGQAGGVVLLAAAQQKVPVYDYTPSQVKVAVTGYGKAPKDQVSRMVGRLLDLDLQPFDAADALAVALCHLQTAGMRAAAEEAR